MPEPGTPDGDQPTDARADERRRTAAEAVARAAAPTRPRERLRAAVAVVPPSAPKRKWLDDESAVTPPPPPPPVPRSSATRPWSCRSSERFDAESLEPVDPWADADPLTPAAAGGRIPADAALRVRAAAGQPAAAMARGRHRRPTARSRPRRSRLPPTLTAGAADVAAGHPAAVGADAGPPAVPGRRLPAAGRRGRVARRSCRPALPPGDRPDRRAAPRAAARRPAKQPKVRKGGPVAPPGWRPPPGYVAVPVRRRRKWPWVLLLSVLCCCGVPGYFAQPLWEQYPASATTPATIADLSLRQDDAERAHRRPAAGGDADRVRVRRGHVRRDLRRRRRQAGHRVRRDRPAFRPRTAT